MNDALTLQGRRVLLGVTGSIAAYRAAELASALVKRGAQVDTVLTAHALRFIGPDTFRALTRRPPLTDLFDEPEDHAIAHIELARDADVMVIAPATANIIAKIASGIADDLLSTMALVPSGPRLIAPAMNTRMWENPITQRNVRVLQDHGWQIIEPAGGWLACGEQGAGRLADMETLLAAIDALWQRPWAGIRVLVSAGPTVEPIDPVRHISNRSSGKMGYAIAARAAELGARVTLVSGPVALTAPRGVQILRVHTVEQMMQAVHEQFPSTDLFISAAAPADYRVASPEERKHKKETGNWTLQLEPTPDILRSLSALRTHQVVVGFAAETDDVETGARRKLAEKPLDLIVANDVSEPGSGFDVDTNRVTLIWADGRTDAWQQMSKRSVAAGLLDRLLPLVRERQSPSVR